VFSCSVPASDVSFPEKVVLGDAFGGAVADIDVELDGQIGLAEGVTGVPEGI
jgi:hypothetical protein